MATPPDQQAPPAEANALREPPARAQGPRTSRRDRAPLGSRLVKPLAGLLAILVIWEAVVRLFAVPNYLLIGPIESLAEFVDRPHYYFVHIMVTLQESVIGFVGGAAAGIAFGVLLYYIPLVKSVLYPSLVAVNTIPKVALAPIFVVWFGFGLASKSMVALSIAFFPVVVATVDGLASVPVELRELARINRAPNWLRVRKIDLIHALPSIFTGMKVSISMAVGGAVVGEFIAGRQGLGYVIQVANSQVNLAPMFASFIALAAMALLLFVAVGGLGRLLLPWASLGDR